MSKPATNAPLLNSHYLDALTACLYRNVIGILWQIYHILIQSLTISQEVISYGISMLCLTRNLSIICRFSISPPIKNRSARTSDAYIQSHIEISLILKMCIQIFYYHPMYIVLYIYIYIQIINNLNCQYYLQCRNSIKYFKIFIQGLKSTTQQLFRPNKYF